ncbi:MAG: hypothetical protein Q9181_003184 [Wetmoreana brouardii]
MRLQPSSIARHHARRFSNAVIHALEPAVNAKKMLTVSPRNTSYVRKYVDDDLALATILVQDLVTVAKNVGLVKRHASEVCPELYCRECAIKLDARVDLFEMKSYAEIDLNEAPIVVLACGHFFTSDTLDGHMRITDMYVQDGLGKYLALRDVSAELAQAIP